MMRTGFRCWLIYLALSAALWACGAAPVKTGNVAPLTTPRPVDVAQPVTAGPTSTMIESTAVEASPRAPGPMTTPTMAFTPIASAPPSTAEAVPATEIAPTSTTVSVAAPSATPDASAPTPPPAILGFTADRLEANQGESVTFHWKAQGVQVLFCPGRPPCDAVAREGSATVLIDHAQHETDPVHFGLIATNNPANPDADPVAKALIAITVHCPACAPPTLTPWPTATPWPEDYRNAWSTYANTQYGFQFNYPTFYDAVGCGLQAGGSDDNIVTFGSWNWLSRAPANGLGLSAYVDQAIAALGFEAVHYQQRDEARYNREPKGILVNTVISHHFVSLVFFQRGDSIYQFFARHTVSCMAPEIGFSNPTIFYDIVDSFRFTP